MCSVGCALCSVLIRSICSLHTSEWLRWLHVRLCARILWQSVRVAPAAAVCVLEDTGCMFACGNVNATPTPRWRTARSSSNVVSVLAGTEYNERGMRNAFAAAESNYENLPARTNGGTVLWRGSASSATQGHPKGMRSFVALVVLHCNKKQECNADCSLFGGGGVGLCVGT